MTSIVNILKENYKECALDNTPIDGSIIFKSKLFHNDNCTFINNTFTDITSKRNTFLMGGILKLSNNVFYRENNKYLYEFIPLNWRYPKFMVASEIKTNLIKKKEIGSKITKKKIFNKSKIFLFKYFMIIIILMVKIITIKKKIFNKMNKTFIYF
jgi:hypothetical protein